MTYFITDGEEKGVFSIVKKNGNYYWFREDDNSKLNGKITTLLINNFFKSRLEIVNGFNEVTIANSRYTEYSFEELDSYVIITEFFFILEEDDLTNIYLKNIDSLPWRLRDAKIKKKEVF